MLTWSDGRSYTGNFQNDLRHGYGIYKSQNGSVVECPWFENKQHGFGVHVDRHSKRKYAAWNMGRLVEKLDIKKATEFRNGVADPKAFTGSGEE